MKIIFTNSPLQFSHGHTFTQPDWQTLVLPLLAGIVDKKHDIKLVDNMDYSFFKSNNILNEIRDFNPDIVGFSIIASRDIFKTMDVIKEVRKRYPELILIAGGQAATYYYEWLHKIGVNFVIHREGEITLKELIESIENGKDYSKILGISYIKKGKIQKNKERELSKNLNESPIPRFDLMQKRKSRYFPGRYTGSIEMSRGCPFSCNFCAISAFWKSFRQKSNDRIIEEIRILKEQGRTHIYLADDNFAMDAKKNTELFKRIIQEGFDIKFFAQIRTDTVAKNPEMMHLAAKAGLYGVLVGFDTYDLKTFNDVTKIGSIELNIKAAKILRKNKIAIFGCHIYGLPSQKTPEDFLPTFKLGRKYSDLFRMPHFSPLPFTKGYEDVVKINPKNTNLEIKEEDKKDFRPRIGDEKQKKRMEKGYDRYMRRHNFSFSEISGAIWHPNPIVKKFKRYGYIATARHKFYKLLRRVKLTDI